MASDVRGSREEWEETKDKVQALASGIESDPVRIAEADETGRVGLTEAQRFRMWVLRQWRPFGWLIAVDRLDTQKGRAAIKRLIRDGYLEEDGGFYRITDAGRAALTDSATDRRGEG